MIGLILIVAALVLCFLAAINVPSTRFSLGWTGVTCLIVYALFIAHVGWPH